MAVADFEKGTKVCIRCKRELPLSCFCIKRQVRDGLNPYCRECEQERKVLKRMSNPSVARNKSEYDRKYRSQKNRRITRSEMDRRKRLADEKFHLIENLRSYMNQSLSGKIKNPKRFVEYLNCTYDEFKRYIESKFLPGMTWNNRGKTIDCWSIDHIVPFDYFNVEDKEEFRVAANYLNCRPVWNKENLSKGSNLPENYRDIIDMIKNNLYGNQKTF